MLYFAYGSNLSPAQMRERSPRARVVGLAALHDHRLVFPRNSERWGGGSASVQPAHGSTVWGMLYDLEDAEMTAQDGFEGFQGAGNQHNHYDREQFNIELVRPDDGSIPGRVRAWVYVARPDNPRPPSRRYLDVILAGARHHRLPEDYVAALAATPTAVEEEPSAPSQG